VIKDTILGIGTILALLCAFLIAGFVTAVFIWTCRFTARIVRFFKAPAIPKNDEEIEKIKEFLDSKDVFVRDPLQYSDKNKNGIDDLDETR